ncbi:uncharacterized protein LOC117629560 [Prunus dulcis]|uniref:uncharacterized protein LOC117629560 n=1 Tax=Prunus dulcis TaxID=3755 RepID=UPI0014823CF9|nr:uncharacterized protein LOC117629560 [Prunus dulcis]
MCKYEGGDSKGLIVPRTIKFAELLDRVHQIGNTNIREDKICLKFSVSVASNEWKHIKIEDDDDVNFFMKYNSEVTPSKLAPLLVSIEDKALTNDVVHSMHITTDSSRMGHSSVAIVESNEVTWNNTNVTDLGAGQLPKKRLGGESEPTRQHYWRQMGEKNRYNAVGVKDEEAYLDNGFSRSDWKPKITVGQIFSSKKALLTELLLTALRGHFEFKVQFSCTKRLLVVCSQRPCPWRVRASRIGEYSFMIVRCTTVHECDLSFVSDKHRQATTALVASSLKRKLKDCRTIYTPSDIMRDVKHNFGCTIHYSKAWKARELALLSIRGSAEEAYYILPAYCYELERMNPGTKTDIRTDENNHFVYLFMAFGACIRGFRSSMRPVIAVDATHLKSKYKGVMFVANAFDGNLNIYPLAFGIGDLETDASWHWFFTKLHEAIGECPNLVIISDRNVSIENVWNKNFPTAQHGICFYHMKGNMKRTFKLKKRDHILMHFEKAAKSYSIAEFDCHFRKIKRKEHVAQYLEEAGLHKWSRAHMDGRRYNVMTTNIEESINSVLRFARMLPVVHLIGEIVKLLVKWFTERRELALNCTTTLCPNFGERKLRNRLEDAARMNVVKVNNAQYNVLDGDMDGLGDLTNNSCSCRKFQLEQLPCKHVVAVCRFLKVSVYAKASRYYTQKTWMDAYSDSIYPVQPHGMWDTPKDVRSRVVLPPMARVMPGRRKKLRIPSQGEGSIRRKCSRCCSAGHNKSTCKNNIPLRNVS